MPKLFIIAHDMRSAHNVGSLLRTADGLGVDKVYLTGYTPYPRLSGAKNDPRLPHIANKLDKQIHKTALGAEQNVKWEHNEDITMVIKKLKHQGVTIAALEQTKAAITLPSYSPPDSIALLLGTEVTGLDDGILKLCDLHLVIPMFGKKESFNVVQAAAMAMYHIKFCI